MSTARVCKFPKQVREISYDSGQTWSATTDERIKPYSEPIERNSVDCGFSYSSRTVVSGSTCNGYHKYTKLVDEVTYDGGLHWEIKEGSEQLGTLIERWSTDCCQLRTYSATVCTELFRQANVDIEQASLDGENWVDTGRYTVNEYLDEYNLDCMRANNVKFLGVPTTGATGASYFDYKEYTVTTASTAQTAIGANDNYVVIGCESDSNTFCTMVCDDLTCFSNEYYFNIGAAVDANIQYIFINDCAENPKIEKVWYKEIGGTTYLQSNLSSLEKIYISSGVSGVLGNMEPDIYYRYSVKNSTSLTEVVGLENSQITEIGQYFFNGCTSLKSMHFPSTCYGIGSYAFKNCTSLSSVTFDCKALRYGVEDIGYGTSYYNQFYNCTSLTDVTFPSDYYGEIYTGMFRNCPITAITLGNPSEYGDYSFKGNHLASVNLGNRVTRIGQHAFESSTLTDVYIGQTANILVNVYNNSFSSGVTIHVPCEAYGYWHQVADFDHPDVGWTIVIDGSSGCAETQWVESGTTCVEYDKYSREIEQVRYSSDSNWFNTGNERVGSRLIETNSLDCGFIPTNYKIKVEFADSSQRAIECNGNSTLSRVEANHYGSNFTKCWISECVTAIGNTNYVDYVFKGNSSLRDVYLPNSLTRIGDDAFENCTSLTNITIPSGVTIIRGSAFYGCTSLTSITFPSSVTSIGGWAFAGCNGITSITFESITPPTLDSYSSTLPNNGCPIYVPAQSVEAYKTANRWDNYVSRIQPIPNS